MDIYVMFCFIESVGGGQSYVNSKVKYLQQNNWKVIVFSPLVDNAEHSPWNELEQFMDYRSTELQYAPEFWPGKVIARTLKWMQEIIGGEHEKIIIESHTDYFAEWGELLAERLHAKHICFLLDERLELYGAKEFLYYKYLRGEVAGIHKSSIPRLFHNYMELEEKEGPVLAASPYIILQEGKNEKLDSLTRMDWNIAYIGRNKQYVPNIVDGVIKFASMHGEKEIQFLILGDVGNITYDCPDNLHIKRLGFITPIPKRFFDYVDVVIAGAGCATIARMAGALTIVANAGTCMSNGLLGYTTDDTLFGGGLQESFDAALENALVKKIWKDIPYRPKQIRSEAEVEQFYREHFKFIEHSDQSIEYFDFRKHPQKNYTRIRQVKYYMKRYAPGVVGIMQKIRKRIKFIIVSPRQKWGGGNSTSLFM